MENPFDEYFSYDPRKDLEQFSKIPTETWIKIGEQKALENFQAVSKAVPAYRDFLQKNKINPESIKTIEDFKKLPLTTKENYFKKYPLKDLVMGGDLSKTTVIHTSSGSTGKSLYWPKSVTSDVNTYKGIELLYAYYFDFDRINTLFINCFGMGSWAAGEMNHTAVKMMAEKGLKVSVVSPGTNIELFLTIFQDLANNFEQVVIGGYPSFLKALVDESIRRKIDLKSHKIKIITGGEKYSENWKKLLIENFGISDPNRSIASVLGTSETGVTSISTPFTDFFRTYYENNKTSDQEIFSRKDLPTVTQVITPARFIEIVNDNIVVSCPGFVPLIRYDTKDKGQILNPSEITSKLPKSFLEEFNSLNQEYGLPNLPILTIDGRSDGTLILYGANIYHEQIGYVLDLPEIAKYATGTFEADVLENSDSNPYIRIALELKPEFEPTEELQKTIQTLVTDNLVKINSEYSDVYQSHGKKVKPLVELKTYKSNELVVSNGKAFKLKNSDKNS